MTASAPHVVGPGGVSSVRNNGRAAATMAAGLRYKWDFETEADLPLWWSRWVNSNGPFDWFATLTFKRDVSPDAAVKLHDRWTARVLEGARHVRNREARVEARSDEAGSCPPRVSRPVKRLRFYRVICAVEWTHAGRVHLHSVLRAEGMQGLSRKRWALRWERLALVCGMARVLEASGPASHYLAKYTGKGGAIIGRGNLARWGPARSRAQQPESS